jgi:hypothetical protein
MAEPQILELSAAVEAATEELRRWQWPGQRGKEVRDLVTKMVAAAAPHIVTAERQRIYAQLGNDHYVIFTEDNWTVEHSVECRLSGRMHECSWFEAIRRITTGWEPAMLGRWRITGISEGLPDLERAEGEVPG